MIYKKVNMCIHKPLLSLLSSRFLHQECLRSSRILHPIESRKLLKISGDDVTTFLQGLITNDMRHFEDGAKSMYSMFLNNKGRILYETLIYKRQDQSYLVECDSSIVGALEKHLKMFKLRKKIAIDDINSDVKLWVLTQSQNTAEDNFSEQENLEIYNDPRLADLGFRIIAPRSLPSSELAKTIGEDTVINDTENDYKYLRYSLGVSEGTTDVHVGSSFPLEANCDYLHGISFHKGCYIGQELTARTHHTGVVRKRIMPLSFNETIEEEMPIDLAITSSTNTKSSIGKLKGVYKDRGLALVRIKEAMEAESLLVGKYTANLIKPNWWPVEAPKEKLNVTKTE